MVASTAAAWAGSARDYLNAPVDTWLTFYDLGYSRAVTPEDGLDVTSAVRTNVTAQSFVATRTLDVWGRTGGISLILPYAIVNTTAGEFRASANGVSDVGMLFQVNLFGGPALSREQFRSFVPRTRSGSRSTPITTWAARPASTASPSATPPTRCDSGPAWA